MMSQVIKFELFCYVILCYDVCFYIVPCITLFIDEISSFSLKYEGHLVYGVRFSHIFLILV